jgi:subtilisin family serine protease
MCRRLVAGTVAGIGLVHTAIALAQEPTFTAPQEVQAVPGEFIVRFSDAQALEQSEAALAGRTDVEVVGTTPLVNAMLVRFVPSAEVGAVSEVILSLPGVSSFELNYRVFALLVPNDTGYGAQWALPKIKAPAAWDVLTSSPGVIVAVVDTGVDYDHVDLSANIWQNTGETPGNNVDDDNNGITDDIHGANFVPTQASGDPMDDHGHGTHVAGTISAVTNNATGVAGVTWQAQIMALKFLDSNGSGTVFNAIRAIEYGIGKGAHIMNNSWGGGGPSQALRDAIAAADAQGILFVAAAGNANNDNDQTPFYPASYDVANVLAVMASDQGDDKAGFSNFGANSVDIAAPGVGIRSTIPDNNYADFSGTSMAAPHVSGAAALVKGQDSSREAPELKGRILESAEQIPALAGLSVTGGRLDLAAALSAVPTPAGAACSLCYTCGGEWSTFSGAIPTRENAMPWERGESCSGELAPANDIWPYLCCR